MRLFLLRQNIQKTDRQILKLLKKRFFLSKEIAKEKRKEKKAIKNEKVEQKLLYKYTNGFSISENIRLIYKEIFKQSREFQKKINSQKY
ncbi:MAG: hypothetical protein C0601_05910 [Candidatus Muiribacterium halophilum]|uniref:Chorismate mutase domain-containing protein n=1 Tax=Muiribacterium halophilum TaxID=2053465 RepID=A0A2N5ZH92_MUIH1|nr:MAG: hypothetical protein C0601_05910 [Candidatus Muirbacterium halophilum]